MTDLTAGEEVYVAPASDEYDSISAAQALIAKWADKHMPNREYHHALRKMLEEELPELLASECLDPLEFADVAILLFDIAHLQGIDIGKAIRDKMAINRQRKWKTDERGLLKHV